ncbi:P-loop containing nucleoside triphosphate hydrolase protein, partial [Lyophyllum atratum]
SQGELDLPRITVIGNQSAGKSSVVEAISGITVPRDAGTCTRCPMECRLSSSTRSWACQISIRREFDASGNVLENVTEAAFGHVITDKKNVELALRRAQVAVLNPHLDPSNILRAPAESLTKQPFVSKQSLDFSRDTICIDLEGPELTDLSFIDLPGLIQNAEPKTIKLVEDMVVSHIKGNCLILVALPMTDDIENQKALRLARQEDPNGRRTIGVMTKPDMLTSGSTKARDIWLDIIEGRRHPLVHGYYCTRQPDDEQRKADITPAEARVAEAAFFLSTHPWSTSPRKDRFGTTHLIATLSKLLVGIINDTLPRIMAEAANKLETCTRELAELPAEIEGDPATYMLRLLTTFCDDVTRATSSGREANKLIRENRDTYAALKTAIRHTAPNFIPSIRDYVDQEPVAGSSKRKGSSGTSIQVDTLTKSKPFFLNDMKEHIQQSITRELPNNVPFAAKAVLIEQFQAGWESAIEVCFAAVRQQVETMLEQSIKSTFYRYEHLEGRIRIFVSEIVQKHFGICAAIVQHTLKAETTPFTQNTHYLSESHAKWLTIYKAARSGRDGEPASKKRRTTESGEAQVTKSANGVVFNGIFSTPAAPQQQQQQHPERDRETKLDEVLAALSAVLGHPVTAEDLTRLKPPDKYESEMNVMAEVRGYFQIAYKRIIDNVPSLIDCLFVKATADDMQSSLITKFALGTADATDRCGMYLAENPLVVVTRKELSARKKRLEEVKQALHSFGLS